MDISNDTIIERIFSLWDAGVKDDEVIINTISDEFNLESNDAESFLELTQAGYLRANFIIKRQQYPKSNLNNNPIVKSAIAFGLSKLGQPNATRSKQNKPWWKFW